MLDFGPCTSTAAEDSALPDPRHSSTKQILARMGETLDELAKLRRSISIGILYNRFVRSVTVYRDFAFPFSAKWSGDIRFMPYRVLVIIPVDPAKRGGRVWWH